MTNNERVEHSRGCLLREIGRLDACELAGLAQIVSWERDWLARRPVLKLEIENHLRNHDARCNAKIINENADVSPSDSTPNAAGEPHE